MSNKFNDVLKNAYYKFRDDPNPPLPLDMIRSYLEDEGIEVENNNK